MRSFISWLRINSIVIALTGIAMTLPMSVAFLDGQRDVAFAFLFPICVSVIVATVIFVVWHKNKIKLSVRMTFVTVASAWVCVTAFGALPLFLCGAIKNFTDAFFEASSGFSTTGATVINDIESLPVAINLWRCQMNHLGGMGIVALTVALLPLLGVGGFQLIKAETTGPEKGKITAHIATTAKMLWLIYMIFTIVQTVLLLLCGMNFIDALAHSFSTLGTGGFGMKNESIGAYNSASIEIVCTIFMILSGANFNLYYFLLKGKVSEVQKNSELKMYLFIVALVSMGVSVFILPQCKSFLEAIRTAFFHVASVITTTGFSTRNFCAWPVSAQFLILLLYFVGGCSGSTGGGVKVIRWVVLAKQTHHETENMMQPHGVFTMRLNGSVARKDIVNNVAAFVALYFALVLITAFVGSCGGLDLLSALTAALSMVGNVGPAFGALSPDDTLAFLPAFVKWWYCFAMIAGRLELFTMLIFFAPSFWKK